VSIVAAAVRLSNWPIEQGFLDRACSTVAARMAARMQREAGRGEAVAEDDARDARPARRVLVLAYFLPPVGGGSTARNSSVLAHLPALGYEPVVVTGSGRAEHYWAPHTERFSQRLAGARVLRIPGPEPEAARGLRRRAERLLDLQSEWHRWWVRGARELGRQLCSQVDLIYASLEPYESAFVACELARVSGRPWVAELLDPWALDEMRMHVSLLHRMRDRRRMRRSLASAAAVIMNTPEARSRLERELPELRDRPIESVALGFDRSDFEPPPPSDASADVFRIVHTGFFHTELGLKHRRSARLRRLLGGLYAPVDVLTRSHAYLLRAIERTLERDPGLRGRIELHLAGSLTPADRAVIGSAPAGLVVREHGQLPHERSIALIRSADLLFLPLYELPPGRRAGIVPGKTYEYLASGRPILAALPEGDARDLLAAAGTARLVGPSDVAAMSETLTRELGRWQRGEEPPRPRREVVERYERAEIARQLASLFDRLLVPAAVAPRTPF
jgi:glycosyltransferase involved in cell wall biosynthesis